MKQEMNDSVIPSFIATKNLGFFLCGCFINCFCNIKNYHDW